MFGVGIFSVNSHLQVFGGLLMSPAEEGQDETDSGASPEGEKEGEVREHVVDILFSKNKLSGLQKQVNHYVTHVALIVWNDWLL